MSHSRDRKALQPFFFFLGGHGPSFCSQQCSASSACSNIHLDCCQNHYHSPGQAFILHCRQSQKCRSKVPPTASIPCLALPRACCSSCFAKLLQLLLLPLCWIFGISPCSAHTFSGELWVAGLFHLLCLRLESETVFSVVSTVITSMQHAVHLLLLLKWVPLARVTLNGAPVPVPSPVEFKFLCWVGSFPSCTAIC